MNKRELKVLIKECLAELFVEMSLSDVIGEALKKIPQTSTNTISENHNINNSRAQSANRQYSVQPSASPKFKKEELVRKMGIDDNTWNSIYSDINTSKLPPAGAMAVHENPEFTSEDDLRKLGLL